MERRSFLQVAAAAAMPAGKKIRAGMIGTQHAHADGKLKTMLESPDYEVVGVSEAHSEARKRKEVSPLYRSVRWVPETDLLSDSSIDLIAVETRVPDLMRAGQNAIAAGKHLHLDKPPGPDMAAFRELVEEARRKKLLLQTGYIWRFHEGVTAAIKATREGWLGQVYMMRGTINTDLAPEARTGLAQYRGGMMFELGCHLIDRLVDLWGRPKAVRTWLRHDTKIDDRLADNTLAVFEYDHGLATIATSAKMPNQGLHRSFELIGTEGSVMIQPIEPGNKMRIDLREPRGPYKAGWQEIEFPNQVRYVGDFRELARALRSRQPLKFSYDHELLVQETLLRACGELPS